MKTLRAFLAERMEDLADVGREGLAEVVGDAVMATRDWLAQPEIVVLIENGIVETGSTAGAALALRREAVK